MLVWLKANIHSPHPARCGTCGCVMPSREANILVHFAPRIPNEDPLKEEEPYASVLEVKCDPCLEEP